MLGAQSGHKLHHRNSHSGKQLELYLGMYREIDLKLYFDFGRIHQDLLLHQLFIESHMRQLSSATIYLQ
jgi:hypothetical protein